VESLNRVTVELLNRITVELFCGILELRELKNKEWAIQSINQSMWNSNIRQFNNSTVTRFNDSTIPYFNDSTVQQFHDSAVPRFYLWKFLVLLHLQQFNSSTIQQFNSYTITRFHIYTIPQKNDCLHCRKAQCGKGYCRSTGGKDTKRWIHRR